MKKIKSNILKSSIFVVLILIMGIFIVKGIAKSYAASSDLPNTMTAKSVTDITAYRGTELGEDLTTSIKYLTDGTTDYVVYCLEKDKGWPTTSANVTYTKSSSAMDVGYSYIMINGYPNKSFTGNTYDDNYITQLAVWLYQDRNVDNSVLSNAEVTAIQGYRYYNYVSALVTGAENAKTTGIVPNPTFTVSKNNFTYDTTSGYYISSKITVSSNVSFEDYKVSLSGVNNYQILDENNNIVIEVSNGTLTKTGTIDYGKGFKIKIPSTATITSQTINLSLIANYTQYDTYLYTPPASLASAEQEVGISALVPTAKTKTVQTSFELPNGSLTIEKKDGDNKTVDATLQVRVTGPNNYNQLVTINGGSTTLSNLVPGEYTVEEVTPPRGYTVTDSQSVTVTTVNKKVTLSDEEISVHIDKQNEAGEHLAGATIEVYDVETNEVLIKFTTGEDEDDNDYEINEPLVYGRTYIAHEVRAPEGYILDTQTHEFTVTKTNYSFDFTFINTKNGINVIKLDQDNKCFAGAELELYKEDNTFIERWTTACNGTTAKPHKLEGLAAGNYYVKEKSVPDGYILSSAKEEFTVSINDSTTKTVTFTNTKRGVSIKKVDEDGIPLAGAVLEVYNDAGTYSHRFTTKATPETIDDIPVGSYKVREISAPSGYIKSNEIKPLVITDSTTNASVTFTNTKRKIKIIKIDQYGNYVSGAKLELRTATPAKTLLKSWTTTNVPYEIEGLDPGQYILVETEGPDGYVWDNEESIINVPEEPEADYTIEVINEKFDIDVLKVDENNNPLEGVELELLDSNDTRLKSWVTTTSPYSLGNLAYGTYYIREVSTIDGYILDTTKHKLVIDDNTETKTITISNKPITAEFAKVDSKTNELIAGATLKLSRVDGTMDPITWETTKSKKVITKLKKGQYILEETKAPAGYVDVGNKITFEIKETGEVQSISMKDNYITATIANKKITIDTSGVAGFKFKLVNEQKEEVDNWTSTAENYTTENLAVGKYFLYEEDVPEGYILQEEPYELLVSNTNTVDTIRMVNNPITVTVSKKDFTNGEEVPGAELVLKDNSGETIDTWISTTTEHRISRLPAGKYTLIETIAPDGYVLSKEQVEFEVKASGDIQTAVMFNEPKVDVPNTAQNTNKVLYVIAAVLLLAGSGVTASVFLRKQ